MKKMIFLFILLMITMFNLKAQYIVTNQIVLPELELRDSLLQTQLDSILFNKYPCYSDSSKIVEKYTYFVTIREIGKENYTIDIVYTKPSDVEDEVNTGIYIMKDVLLVVREYSDNKIFNSMGRERVISYEKKLVKRDNSYHLHEVVNFEEFCVWGLLHIPAIPTQ
ncbi:hypothetical protein D0T84_22040 [Dysgonomonas sp. 521]|uniref:hypothetical protein n=1 Tax=Dysgonomonas sp. 521 TaxID=2302932 RepID=UPI0013D7B72C|nr:hypothetical protein [Dysgonomonas sp. 521]NDV97546.1 hypothetical protein [Dysgonomonas sp. 521]